MTFGTPIKTCRDIGKTSEELGIKTDNNWQVSKKTIEKYEAMRRQQINALANIRHIIMD